MKYRIIVLLLLLFQLRTVGQTMGMLRGHIIDERGKPIFGATVCTLGSRSNGTTSDIDGSFGLQIDFATDSIKISFIGYETLKLRPVNEGKYVLTESIQNIDEVMIRAVRFDHKLTATQIGAEDICIEQIKNMPSLFGETDIIKSITLLPGIRSAGDGTIGFQVRGGTVAQNLVLLDDAPIYNAGHAMGIFSTFNDDVLGHATLYKGLVPAQFGGAVSSVLDVTTQSGEATDFRAGVDIGILSSNAYAKGSIFDDKLSYHVAARRSYFDLFLKLSDKYKNNSIYFYDINAKINYNPTNRDRISLSLFTAKDRVAMKDLMDINWGNKSASLQWFHWYNDLTTSNTSLITSRYTAYNYMNLMNLNAVFCSGVNSYALKHRVNIERKHILWSIGVQASLIDVTSGDYSLGPDIRVERRKGVETAVWGNADYKLAKNLSISGGIRLTSFACLGGSPYYEFDSNGEIIKQYDHYGKTDVVAHHLHLEPRLSANWRLSSNQSIKTGYSRTTQNVYNILNASKAIPYTRYTMPSNYLKPIIADQVSLAYTRLLSDDKYELSVEAYYKNLENIYDYRNGKRFNSDIVLESLLLCGRGRSYGAEFLAKKNIGKLTGWIGYTLSWTQNKIDGINNNEWYTANNDIRHDLSIVGLYKMSKHWSASASWIYQTGQALNVPSAKYEVDGEVIYYFAERNGYRAPDYHRLDVSFTYEKKMRSFIQRWSFGVYNLYMQYNPFIISFEDDPTSPTGTKTMLTAIFGMLPSITYGIHF